VIWANLHITKRQPRQKSLEKSCGKDGIKIVSVKTRELSAWRHGNCQPILLATVELWCKWKYFTEKQPRAKSRYPFHGREQSCLKHGAFGSRFERGSWLRVDRSARRSRENWTRYRTCSCDKGGVSKLDGQTEPRRDVASPEARGTILEKAFSASDSWSSRPRHTDLDENQESSIEKNRHVFVIETSEWRKVASSSG